MESEGMRLGMGSGKSHEARWDAETELKWTLADIPLATEL